MLDEMLIFHSNLIKFSDDMAIEKGKFAWTFTLLMNFDSRNVELFLQMFTNKKNVSLAVTFTYFI